MMPRGHPSSDRSLNRSMFLVIFLIQKTGNASASIDASYTKFCQAGVGRVSACGIWHDRKLVSTLQVTDPVGRCR